VPLSVTFKPWARASQPTMVAISCTSCLVSLAFVDWERRRLSFARRQGCVETWTLDGREEGIVTTGRKRTAVRWCGEMIGNESGSSDELAGEKKSATRCTDVLLLCLCCYVEANQSVRSSNNVCADKVDKVPDRRPLDAGEQARGGGRGSERADT
jgi:hypothetical protein